MKNIKEEIDIITNKNRVLIYGAGVMGHALKLCLESKPYNKKVQKFIVFSEDNNPKEINGTPVIGIEKAGEYREETIIVALNEKNMSGAVEGLHNHGFKNLILLDAACDEWSDIKMNYFMNNQDKCYLPFKMLSGK